MAPSADLSLPKIQLELLEDLSPPDQTGFLRLVRRRYRATYPDGSESVPFVYDAVDRSAIDAVVIAAHFVGSDGAPRVFLRSCFRPPLTLRDRAHSPLPEEACDGQLWELPAGLVDTAEQSPTGVARAAQRELLEELGFEVSLDALSPLGHSTFPRTRLRRRAPLFLRGTGRSPSATRARARWFAARAFRRGDRVALA